MRIVTLRTVRTVGRWLAGIAAVGFGCLAYVYLTLPDVRPLKTINPSMTAFMELRAREAHARGLAPRRVQRWVSYRQISHELTRAVLVAEDDAFWKHEGVDFEQLQESIEIDWARGRLVRGAKCWGRDEIAAMGSDRDRPFFDHGQGVSSSG